MLRTRFRRKWKNLGEIGISKTVAVAPLLTESDDAAYDHVNDEHRCFHHGLLPIHAEWTSKFLRIIYNVTHHFRDDEEIIKQRFYILYTDLSIARETQLYKIQTNIILAIQKFPSSIARLVYHPLNASTLTGKIHAAKSQTTKWHKEHRDEGETGQGKHMCASSDR